MTQPDLETLARECAHKVLLVAGEQTHEPQEYRIILSALERATEGLRADNERMREGEKWAATMFCNIMVQAMSGIADSAIIAHQQYTAEHSRRHFVRSLVL